ncbi:MAG: bifunctional ornithine acetyltransferase/N-acetylglutamate synthase [Clostridia bacterium]|nr:bifunctional ornithine acetyltransferase/N-acetylglutamate synthase [Clostridia bacterium]
MKICKVPGGVTTPKGFKAACCAAGIKYQGRTDMAMIVSAAPCAVAGTFTTNKVKAAPVLWDMDVVYKNKSAQAVVVNAGIANAATGKTGLDICKQTADFAGATLGIPAGSVLLGSTGVIGPNLPLDRIQAGVKTMAGTLSDTLEAGTAASKAIMTTDTVNKEFAVEFELPAANGSGSVTVHMGGMSKGSGMIHPNMCTMLGYVTTDCLIDQALLQKALSAIVPDTFNMITVDGDTSTNDTLLVLANGMAGNAPIADTDESYAIFCEALFSICRDLAVKMAEDGEGATHLLEMRVYNADTKENARTLAKSVVGSSLVKAMVFGKDANCGRILCALGYAGPDFDPAKIEVHLHGEKDTLCFYENGCIQAFDEEKALKILSEKAVRFSCNMNMGDQEATAWGCDLTYDYVKINGDYRT